jgi:hypothetical protein
MVEAGLGAQVTAGEATISLTFLRDHEIGELLMGPGAFQAAVTKVGERVHEYHLMLLGVDGPRALGPPPRVLFVQGGDTLRPAADDFIDAGGISLGKLEGAFRRPMLLLVDHALDVSAPFRIGLGQCCGNPPVLGDYVLQEPIPEVASVLAPAGGAPAGGSSIRAMPDSLDGAGAADEVSSPAEGSATTPTPVDAIGQNVQEEHASGLSPVMRLTGILLLTALAIAGVAAVARGAARRAAERADSGHRPR